MSIKEMKPTRSTAWKYLTNPMRIGGMVLILLGVIALVDLNLVTGQLGIYILSVGGILVIISGLRAKRLSLVVAGILIFSICIGVIIPKNLQLSTYSKVGIFLFTFGVGWLLVFLFSLLIFQIKAWWVLFPGSIFIGTGLAFYFTHATVFGFTLFVPAVTGLVFLGWGITDRKLGLIIPGALMGTIGPGIYYAWNPGQAVNGLEQTGIMLLWFAFGWGIIVLIAKLALDRNIWWPLIPGGLFAVVGWGLSIGGNPGNATGVIGNSGSIGLIIFGIYLLLLRRGINK